MAYELLRTGIDDLVPMHRTGDPRCHISAIIRSLCVKLGHFEVEDEEDMDDEAKKARQTRWELGSAFEEAVRGGLANRHQQSDPGRYVVPGELAKDGLIGSPDLVDCYENKVIEIKLTWLSSRHHPESDKFWKYWVQLMEYVHMIGWKRGELHVCHVMGDYRENRNPVYNVWIPEGGEFPKQDLIENHRMLVSEHRRMVSE